MSKRVIIYARVSTDDQAEKGYSIPSQISKLTEYCQKKGWTIAKTFTEDYSAKDGFDRPAYNKLNEYLKEHRKSINYILVTQWSRFSRNLSASFQELDRLKKLEIAVDAIEQL